jgi:hypothetical protein
LSRVGVSCSCQLNKNTARYFFCIERYFLCIERYLFCILQLALNELADSSHEEVLHRKKGMAPPAFKRAPNDDLPPVPDHDIPEIYNPFPRGVPSHSDCSYKLADVKYPAQIDWRELGVVAPVRNQGHCGAGWAFATTTVVESMNAIMLGESNQPTDQHH